MFIKNLNEAPSKGSQSNLKDPLKQQGSKLFQINSKKPY